MHRRGILGWIGWTPFACALACCVLLAPRLGKAAPILEALGLPISALAELSGDGSTVVSVVPFYDDRGRFSGTNAVRWNAGSAVVIAPGRATGVSRDGNVVVGDRGELDNGFRWTPKGLTTLPDPPAGFSPMVVSGVTEDGEVIVGRFRERSRYRLEGGEYIAINDLGLATTIRAVASRDPSIMAGSVGFRGSLLLDDGPQFLPPLVPGQTSFVEDLSAEGRIAVGWVGDQAVRWEDGLPMAAS